MGDSTEKLAPCPKAPVRLWVVAVLVSFGTAFPTFLGLYFPSNGRPAMQKFFEKTIFSDSTKEEIKSKMDFVWSAYTSVGMAAMVLGKLTTPTVDNTFGRRKALILCTSLAAFTLTFELLAQPVGVWVLSFVGRFLTLFLCGIITDQAPVFLNEVSPPHVRGSVGILFPIAMVLGATVATFLGLDSTLGTEHLWPLAFLVPKLFFGLAVPFLAFIPDTPQCIHLAVGLEKGKPSMEKALLFYHGHLDYWDDVLEARVANSQRGKTTLLTSFKVFKNIMTNAALRTPFLLTLALSASYVFSGIPLLNHYSYTMLDKAEVRNPAYFSFGLQALSLILMFISFRLIDRAGRRPLLLISCAGTALCWPVLVITGLFPQSWTWKPFFVLGVIVVVQIFINIGIKPLIFPVVPELYPMHCRSGGSALGGLSGDLMQLPIIYALPSLLTHLGSFTYLFLAIPLGLCTAFLYFKFPETKGKTPEQILDLVGYNSHKAAAAVNVDKGLAVQLNVNPMENYEDYECKSPMIPNPCKV